MKERVTLKEAIEWAREHNKKPPTIETLIKWDEEGVCKTPCGCRVEPDGYCTHGRPSWLLMEGMI